MLLAVDIGNSSIKFGIFEGSDLFQKFTIQTKRDYTAEELLFDRLKLHESRFLQPNIDVVVISSVVPELDAVISEVCQKLFKVTAAFVDSSSNFGLAVKYDPIASVGTDRLINAFAAVTKYGKPIIVCSFGTATTIDAVNANCEFLGGIIAPGMATMAESLHLKTAKLPRVEIAKPKQVIGSSTESSIMSGIFYGYVGLAEGLISRIGVELGDKAKVIATGGFARVIAPEVHAISIVDENLTLDGLRLVAERK